MNSKNVGGTLPFSFFSESLALKNEKLSGKDRRQCRKGVEGGRDLTAPATPQLRPSYDSATTQLRPKLRTFARANIDSGRERGGGFINHDVLDLLG